MVKLGGLLNNMPGGLLKSMQETKGGGPTEEKESL